MADDRDVQAERVRPLKGVEYERLVAEGYFQDERIELLRGELVAVHSEDVRPIRREEYERMVELGFFQNERVELLRGVLVRMTPQGPIHSGISARLTRLLIERLGRAVEVRTHSPFAARESEPEPDVGVYMAGLYLDRHPTSALLLIEVADRSLRRDRQLKAEIYADAGVPEYWIVDVTRGVVEVRTQPEAGQYGRLVTVARGESIALVSFPDAVVAVDEFLPPA